MSPGQASRAWLLALALALGCEAAERPPDPALEAPADTPAGTAAAGSPLAAPADSSLAAAAISPDGIGAARQGMTLAEIRGSLGAGLHIGEPDERFMVDLVVLPVVRGQDTLYHLVFPADETPADGRVPLLALTDHPASRTPEGIGPGSTLAEAQARYGAPTLSYSADNEMREFAAFPGYPHPSVNFRVAPGDTVFLAGRYEPGAAQGRTTEFDGAARIMMVMVGLRHF